MANATTSRPPNSIQRRVASAFTQRLGLKATAAFLALVLWFVVNAKEPQIELVPVTFAPLLDSSLVLRDGLPQLQAIIAGSPNQLIKLTTNAPVVRRQITADAPDTLVLDLRPEDVILPADVDAVVRDIQPRSLTLRFESTLTRKVPIRSTVEVSAAQWPGPLQPHFEPDSVQISGPRHVILGISSVRTAKTTLPYPDSLPHLVDIDTAALGPGVRVRPAQVKVQLDLMASPQFQRKRP
jgi:YbbR domain-containing protein